MTTETERGVCPDCGLEVALKRDGTPRKHDCEPPVVTMQAADPGVTMPADEPDVEMSGGQHVVDDSELPSWPEQESPPTPDGIGADEIGGGQLKPEPDDEPDDDRPEPVRAGGHINRFDGHGWVLDDTKEK